MRSDAFWRVRFAADDDYPNAARSAMDGFAVAPQRLPAALSLSPEKFEWAASQAVRAGAPQCAFPPAASFPDGADAVVPIEDARVEAERRQSSRRRPGENVIARARATCEQGERVLRAGDAHRRPVARRPGDPWRYRRSGVSPSRRWHYFERRRAGRSVATRPAPDKCAIQTAMRSPASLRAMGAAAAHYPTLPDDAGGARASAARRA